jgi:hypothetical protein
VLKLKKTLTLLSVVLIVLMLGESLVLGTTIAGATTTYGSVNSVVIDITSFQKNVNNISFAIAIQAPAGLSTVWSSTLFEHYIFAGCVLDFDRNATFNALWPHANLPSTSIYTQEIHDHSFYDIQLTRIVYLYRGNVTLPNLPSGTHSLVIYAWGAKNMMSYCETEWAAFSGTVNFTISDPTPSPSPSPTPTLVPTPTVPELSWLLIVPLLLSVFSVALLVRHRKTAKV